MELGPRAKEPPRLLASYRRVDGYASQLVHERGQVCGPVDGHMMIFTSLAGCMDVLGSNSPPTANMTIDPSGFRLEKASRSSCRVLRSRR